MIDEELEARGVGTGGEDDLAAEPDVGRVPGRADDGPGVPLVPKPPGPCFQWLSSKPGLRPVARRLVERVAPGGRLLLGGRHELGDARRRGRGANAPTFARSRLAHFFHVAGSSSILMNTPPITGRARMPSLLGLSVTYESTNGSRAVVSFR